MRPMLLGAVAVAALAAAARTDDKPKGVKVSSPLDYKLEAIDGKELDLSQYKGKVVLLVNVASKWRDGIFNRVSSEATGPTRTLMDGNTGEERWSRFPAAAFC